MSATTPTLDVDALIGGGAVAAARPALLAELKAAYARDRLGLRTLVEARKIDGAAAAARAAAAMDRLVKAAFTFADRLVAPPKGALALAAVGGYGRGELAPFSDVDLLFLTTPSRTKAIERTVEATLYLLWDLGLKVGHATRSAAECVREARDDLTVRTSLLESRFLSGERRLFEEMRTRFQDTLVAKTGPDFLTQKLAERDERHKRLGDSRYVLEPNIKEGKGGLRDLQTLYWIGRYLYRAESAADLVNPDLVALGVLSAAEARRFTKAHEFLWRLRFHLHLLAGRAEERLTFDMQPELAKRLGYGERAGARGVERLMKHYYLVAKTVGNLTGIFCAALEAQHKKQPLFRRAPKKLAPGFVVEGGRVNLAAADLFARRPIEMLRLFHICLTNDLEPHPRALWRVTQHLGRVDGALLADPEANRLFLEILASRKDPETTLRRMNEAGLFGRFVPDFGRVVGQMQHDMYHVYTVDEHTVFALGILSRIERGLLRDDHPLASEVIHKIGSRRALYLALMCHDIAKGRGGDHSELGAVVAEKLARRMGLATEEVETVSWLVLQHLAMSRTAFKRDLSDPRAIADFVTLVQSPERLKLLLCLTVCDIRAVGPTVWNNWKGALLRELYLAADRVMGGAPPGAAERERVAEAQAALRQALPGWSEAELSAHMTRGYPAYWLAFDTATLARQAELVRQAERAREALAVTWTIDARRAATEITVYAGDHPGLFSRIAGALAAAGANIVDARIFTTPQGMALDTLWVQDLVGQAFDDPYRLKGLKRQIEQLLLGEMKTSDAISQRRRPLPRAEAFKVAVRVLINNSASATHTVIEVNGQDRPGLLYDVTRALTAEGLQISTAKIATYGQRAVDVFYVRDAFGMKVEHEAKLTRVRERLLAALGPKTAHKAPAKEAV